MVRGARPQGFSRRHRFHAQGAFGPVLRGRRKFRGALAILHVTAGLPGASRLGIALTRRLVKSAVERNAVKRAVREAFRRHPVKSLGFDCVITLREAIVPANRPALLAEIQRLLGQLHAEASR